MNDVKPKLFLQFIHAQLSFHTELIQVHGEKIPRDL